ncbi:replication initiator [Streptomyces chartreusis]|uniref:replication initiator n=1 Tax=Streptomyces chartreusis TaxID=1969 RepID=UPI0037F5E2B7
MVRLGGPARPDDPPAGAAADRLADAVRASAQWVMVRTPYSPVVGELVLNWGAQIDTPLRADSGRPDDAVAAYVAKYATKGASETAPASTISSLPGTTS